MEHSNSDIDLVVISKNTEDKTTNTYYNDIPVQILWRTEKAFREKTIKKTRFVPASKYYKVLLDKENWIEDFLQSDDVKSTWKEPIGLSEQEKLILSTDFLSSGNQIRGLFEQNKYIEVEAFIYDYIFLGLELLYDNKKWFLETRKYIISDVKTKLTELWDIINSIYHSKKLEDKVTNYEFYYDYIIKNTRQIPKEYTIYWY